MKTSYIKLFLIIVSLFVLTGYIVDNTPQEIVLSASKKKVIENQKVEDILNLVQFIDQLKANNNPEFALRNIAGFGGVFSIENRKLDRTKKLIDSITKHIDSIRKENTSALLESITTEGTVALLPEHLKEEFDATKKEILKANTKITITSAAYNYVYIFNELLPKIKELLEKNKTITTEELLTTYYDAKLSKIKISIVKNILNDIPNTLLNEIISPQDVSELQTKIAEYEALTNINLDILKKYKDEEVYKEKLKAFLKKHTLNKTTYYIKEFNRLEEKVENLIIKLTSFEAAIISEYESVNNLLNKKANAALIKTQEQLDNIISTKNYIDIIPNNLEKTPDFWLRLRLPDNSIEYLREHKQVNGITGSLSLVYKTELLDNNVKLKGKSFIPDVDFDPAQINALKESLKKLVSEIPLGIEISNLSITTESSQNSLIKCIGYDGKKANINDLQVRIPEDSPWTNFKSIIKDQKEIFNRLQISKELGLQLDHITLIPESFDATFSFHVKSTSIIRNIIDLNKDTNAFEFKLSEVQKGAGSISEKLRTLIGKKIAEKLQEVLDDEENKEGIKDLVLADKITSAKITYSEDHIVGHLTYIPIGFTALNKTFKQSASVNLLFKTSLKNGKSAVTISNTFLPYEGIIREYAKMYLENSKDALLKSIDRTLSASETGNLILNLSQKIQFSKFKLDIDNSEIIGSMWIEGFETKKMPVSISKRGLRIEKIETVLKDIIKSKFETYVVSQFEQAIQKECEDLVTNKDISLFTFDFRIEDIDCSIQNTNTSFKAVYKKDSKNFAKIQFDASGNLKILELSAPIIEQEILTKIESNLTQYADFKYLKVKNPRFVKGILLIDAFVQIEAIGLYEKVGMFEIAPDTKSVLEAKFNGFNLKTAFESKINTLVEKKLDALVEKKQLKLEFSEEADGLSITDVEKVQLFGTNRRLVFIAEANLKGLVVPGFKITIDLSNDNILKAISIDLPSNAIINGLLANANFINDLGAEIVPGLNVSVEKIQIQIHPVRLEGFINIEINNLRFPSMKFEITKNDIRFHPALSFPLPGAYLISASPPLTIFGSDVALDLEEKRISFNTNITVGSPGTEEANSRLINLTGSLGAYYAGGQFGNLDLEANLYLITVLNVMEGKGELQTAKGCFKMSSKTKGPLRDVLKFDNQVTVNCDDILFSSQMALDVLGVKVNSNMSANKTKSNSAINLLGDIKYDFLGTAHLNGTIASKLEPKNIKSFAKNTSISLKGDFEIDDFELSSVGLGANYNNAYLDFKVLGANLGVEVPSIRDFSEGMILEKILSLLDFDPEVILEILKDPTKISFKIAPMGVGKDSNQGDDGDSDKNSNGSEPIGGSPPTEGETEPSNTEQTSTKLVDNGTKTQVKSGVFSTNSTMKLLPLKDISNFSKKANPRFPKNINKALVVVNNTTNTQSWPYYIADETATHITPDLNYWITGKRLTPIKRDGSNAKYRINKQLLTSAYTFNPSIQWNVCFNTNNKVYVYLSQNNLKTWQTDRFTFSSLRKEWIADNYQYIHLEMSNREQLFIEDNTFRVTNVPVANYGGYQSRYSSIYTSPKDIFLRNKGDFFNYEGQNIKTLNFVEAAAIRKLKRQYESFENIKAIVVLHQSLFIIKEDNVVSITAYKAKKDEEVRTELERTTEALGKVWIEIPTNAINTVFSQESWFNSTKKFHENIRALQSNTYQGKINNKAYRSFEALVLGLIEDNTIPNSRIISSNKRELLLTTNTETQDKTLMDLTPKNNTTYINHNPPILRVNKNDLTNNLGIVNNSPENFESILKTDTLISNTLINILDGRLFSNDVYLGKNQDKLFFKSGNRLKIQSKDSLWNVKTVLNLHALHKKDTKQNTGDLFNKPEIIKKHTAFFNAIFPIIGSEKEVQLVIEENENQLIAYILDKTNLTIIWETTLDTAQIKSKEVNRTALNNALSKANHKKAALKLINSINNESYDLQELLKFIKKGYLPTEDWFAKDNDFMHSLILLN